MKQQAPVHYLRPNDTVWTPPSVICLDTETTQHLEGDDEVHVMRLWCANFRDRRPPRGQAARDEWDEGISAEDLAHRIHAWTRNRRTIWAYAHNLHFDLSTSDLIGQLRALGYRVTDFAVDGGSPFVRMERGDVNLTICDSFSWLPVALNDIGIAVGIDKPPLPQESDGIGEWLHRCRVDTDILATAMHTLMDWWDRNELGRWTITGGAAGWNVMRHIAPTRRILIDPDPERQAADRLAIYGGKRGAWRTGHLPQGRYAELDLEKAYTVACANMPLPCERMAPFPELPVDHVWVTGERHGIIAEVTVETDVPRWPVRIDGRVWYPVGRFTTTLAGPDIKEAHRLGCLRAIGKGFVHKMGMALMPWARWCLAMIAPGNADTPEVARITGRHWGRSTVGKWAQRGFDRVQLGPAPTHGWDFTEGWNHNQGVRASVVDFGGYRWQVTASGAADNAYPAILAFVEAYVRVALNRAIETFGNGAMVTCDTDGMIVDIRKLRRADGKKYTAKGNRGLANTAPDDAIAAVNKRIAPFVLREKRAYSDVVVIGPQHMVLDGRRRFAGVPAGAVEDADGRLAAQLWPKLGWQMAHGRPGAFVRPRARYHITGTYAPGWVLLDGSVRPVEAHIRTDGATVLTAWPSTRYALAGGQLGEQQNKALEARRATQAHQGNPADNPGTELPGQKRYRHGARTASSVVHRMPTRQDQPLCMV